MCALWLGFISFIRTIEIIHTTTLSTLDKYIHFHIFFFTFFVSPDFFLKILIQIPTPPPFLPHTLPSHSSIKIDYWSVLIVLFHYLFILYCLDKSWMIFKKLAYKISRFGWWQSRMLNSEIHWVVKTDNNLEILFKSKADKASHVPVSIKLACKTPFYFTFLNVCLCMNVLSACMPVHYMHACCPLRSQEGLGSCITGVSDECEPLCGFLNQTQVLLTTESSL